MTDLGSVVGAVLGLLAIAGGQILGGGHLGQIFQFTSGLIVIGGTLGATLSSCPMSDIRRALCMLPKVFKDSEHEVGSVIDEVIHIAMIARKEGVLAVEPHRAALQNALLRKSLKYVTDGFEPATVRELLDAEIESAFESEENAARVFEIAGGYAPAVGILGAVLGLIQVLSALSDPSKIGEGIAVAFVSTLYGLALANLVLLPWSNKLRRKIQQRLATQEVVRLGVLGILDGLSPSVLQERLIFFVEDGKDQADPRGAREKSAAR